MTTTASLRLGAYGQRVAAWIVANVPPARTVLLCGSVAAGVADDRSDVDLVVLCDEPVTRAWELDELQDPRLNVTFHTRQTLQNHYQRDWSYLAYLDQCAVVIAGDPTARAWLTRPRPARDVTGRQIEGFADELRDSRRGYERLIREGVPADEADAGALHDIYRQSRRAVILALAGENAHAWRRAEAFPALAALDPQHAELVHRLAALEPYWRARHRDDHAALHDARQPDVDASFHDACTLMTALADRFLRHRGEISRTVASAP